MGDFDPGDVQRLVMDEVALHKSHRYATVIMDAERTRALWAGKGNSRDAIRPFFELLGERCRQIDAVVMDMNTAFDLEVGPRWCMGCSMSWPIMVAMWSIASESTTPAR